MVLFSNKHEPGAEKTCGCGEASNGSETAGDWAAAVNEKANIPNSANIKVGPHDKTMTANLEQFLMWWHSFRAGTPKSPKVGGDLFGGATIIRKEQW
jgi:hypothetical protein